MAKKILYVDLDGVLVDFRSALPHVFDELIEEFDGHLDDIPGIYSLMEPMPGALVAFAELSALFDAYILSTSPWENPSSWSDKLCWVKAYLGKPAYKRLILTHHKDLNRGDFLIDDRKKHGAGRFAGERIQFGTGTFPDWPSVTAYLRPLAVQRA